MKPANFKRFSFTPLDSVQKFLVETWEYMDLDERIEDQNFEGYQPILDIQAMDHIPLAAVREGNYFPVGLKGKKQNCLTFINGEWYLRSDSEPKREHPYPTRREWIALQTLDRKYLSELGREVLDYWNSALMIRDIRRSARKSFLAWEKLDSVNNEESNNV